jgi:rfaE bifunctional protein kinase chain/domain
MFPAARMRALLARFPERRVVVLGDLIADDYVYGRPSRISREAPVLIVKHTGGEMRLGGAGNAAHNARSLGARVVPVGVLGRDAAGAELGRLIERAGIATAGLVETGERPTPVKTRILAGASPSTRQQLVRVDREPEGALPPAVEDALLERLGRLGRDAHAFVVSDYGYATASPRAYELVLELARASGAVVAVDSRYELPRFRGATAATPNEPELEALWGAELDGDRDLEKAGRAVLERLDARLLLVTRGSRGMALFEREGPASFVPIHGTDEIADVTGAGDTVIAAFALALAAGAAPGEAAWLANVAGGVVVMKRGIATVSAGELGRALGPDGAPGRA